MSHFKYLSFVLVTMLAVLCWHYRGASDRWHQRATEMQNRVDELTRDNSGLAAANVDLDKRNNALLESLNARSQQLQRQQRDAANARRDYAAALAEHRDWSAERIPADIAGSLRTGTSVQDAAGGAGAVAR